MPPILTPLIDIKVATLLQPFKMPGWVHVRSLAIVLDFFRPCDVRLVCWDLSVLTLPLSVIPQVPALPVEAPVPPKWAEWCRSPQRPPSPAAAVCRGASPRASPQWWAGRAWQRGRRATSAMSQDSSRQSETRGSPRPRSTKHSLGGGKTPREQVCWCPASRLRRWALGLRRRFLFPAQLVTSPLSPPAKLRSSP